MSLAEILVTKIVLNLRFFRQGGNPFSCVVRKSLLIAMLSSSPRQAYDFLAQAVRQGAFLSGSEVKDSIFEGTFPNLPMDGCFIPCRE